jgi:hypothetical protein
MTKLSNQQHYERLVAALETLENFTRKNSEEPVPHVYHQDVPDGGTFQKILGLGQCFIKAALSEKTRQTHDKKRLNEESQVLHALNEVRRFHPLIDQNLAERLTQAIQQYNDIVERAKTTPISWEGRILKFLYQKSRLSLSRTHSFELKIEPSTVCNKINSQLANKATTREIDAFRTKAISLLKDSGAFSSVAAILQSVRNAPIDTVSEASTITLEQKLSETVTIRGVFQRIPGGSRPIPNSFVIRDGKDGKDERT